VGALFIKNRYGEKMNKDEMIIAFKRAAKEDYLGNIGGIGLFGEVRRGRRDRHIGPFICSTTAVYSKFFAMMFWDRRSQ